MYFLTREANRDKKLGDTAGKFVFSNKGSYVTETRRWSIQEING